MTLNERLRLLRDGLSRAEFARRLGLPESTLRRYENGDARIPADFISRICHEFSVSADWMLFGVEVSTDQLLRSDAAGQVGGKRYVYVDGEKVRVVCVPVLTHVPAGFALEMADATPVGVGLEGAIWVSDPCDENAYGLVAQGDSMDPVFPDGRAFLVLPRLRFELDNDFGVVRIAGNGECVKCIRRRDNMTYVSSVNERYPSRVLPERDVEILGAARRLSPMVLDDAFSATGFSESIFAA